MPSREENQHQNSEHAAPWMSATVPSQEGNQRLNSEHTRPWISATVPYMKGDEQYNNECRELGVAVKTAQTDLQPSEGSDTLPAGYTKFLYEDKLYKNTWQHRNALSGLDLYEMFKMCNENETMYMFGQESHVACSLPPAQLSPVILVCPLRLHPSFFCSWLGVSK